MKMFHEFYRAEKEKRKNMKIIFSSLINSLPQAFKAGRSKSST
ncbi:hypothetical protein BSSX_2641 [Bacillus subtilis]|nr:hypothetical protein BSSX_2641 [Bacillus subtilis]